MWSNIRTALGLIGTIKSLLVVTSLASTGWAFAVARLSDASTLERMLVGLLGGLLAVGAFVAIAVFWSRPTPGLLTPRYFAWSSLPIRRVRFDFDNFLSMSGRPLTIEGVAFRLRVSWGEGLEPRRCFVECRRTGARQDVLIECGDAYVRAEDIAFMPSGKWFRAQARFEEPGLSPEEFLARWDGFTLHFEHSRGSSRLCFCRSEINAIIANFRSYNEPRPEPRATFRSGSGPG